MKYKTNKGEVIKDGDIIEFEGVYYDVEQESDGTFSGGKITTKLTLKAEQRGKTLIFKEIETGKVHDWIYDLGASQYDERYIQFVTQ